jgi:pimeloyl-ACP methyl ester carboxylesterase
VVLVHGGGGQGTDWLSTPDGRPGWAPILVEAGWTVHVVDRPGHGRSPTLPGGRAAAPPPTLEMTAQVFAPGSDPRHTQWPGPGGPDDPAVAAMTASASPLPADGAAAQGTDADRLADLLDRIGPAVLVTHSYGALAGWLAADRRPGTVAALVAIEPPGPPFLSIPAIGLSLDWGLTTAALTYDPPVDAAAELSHETPGTLPNLAGLPIAVIEAEASPMGAGAGPVAAFLRTAGADAHHLRLAEHGVHGNGHGLMLELNNREALQVVTSWLEAALASRTRPDPVAEAVKPGTRSGDRS